MEEENRKGPGLFYAVVSIATLVVAIIGATFAYFSASIGAQDEAKLEGSTLDLGGDKGTVTLNVESVTFDGATAGSPNLVPATFGETEPSTITEKEINGALNAKCEEKGYTGCHLWKITVNSTTKLASANLKLALSFDETARPTKQDEWSYAVFEASGTTAGSDLAATTVRSKGAFSAADTVATEENFQNEHVYYVLIYLHNTEGQQDAGDTNDATGKYQGVVTLEVASGGQVSASFTAAA